MRNPRSFRKPLAIGAPDPAAEIPVTPSRMIHFFDPSNPRMRDKVPKIAEQVDVLLGNLEDAIPTERKEAAREGFIEVVKAQALRRFRAVSGLASTASTVRGSSTT
jgi:malyl-CoA/(S)-citramalyl-CoA lyase